MVLQRLFLEKVLRHCHANERTTLLLLNTSDAEKVKMIRCLELSIFLKLWTQHLKEWVLPILMSSLLIDLTLILLLKRPAELLINSLEIEKHSTGQPLNGVQQESQELLKFVKDLVFISLLLINANITHYIETTLKNGIDQFLKTTSMEQQSGLH